jgi:hypothetical protein
LGLLLNFVEIQCTQAPVVDHDPAIDDDVSHVASAGISDKLRQKVEAGT